MTSLIRARAPLRLSFAGGGTDLRAYFEKHGGAVVSASINRYARGTLVPLEGKLSVIQSLDLREVLTLPEEEGSEKMKLVQTVLRRFETPSKYKLTLRSDAPPGSGLGSSSSLCVALLAMMRTWLHQPHDPYEIAEEAYKVEREDFGVPGGYQDQVSAAFGGFNFVEFDAQGVHVTPLRVPYETQRELEARLVLAYTGQARMGIGIIAQQEALTRAGDNLAPLHAAKFIALEMKRAILKGDLDQIGSLLHKGWRAKREYAPGVTNPDLDSMYDVALRAGATGGKILGAGGGGYFLMYCPRDCRYDVEQALVAEGATVSDFQFTSIGVEAWQVRS